MDKKNFKELYNMVLFSLVSSVICIVLVILLICSLFITFNSVDPSYKFNNVYDFIPAKQIDFGNKYGFYHEQGFFCVRTKDMTPEQVAETTFHELAHYYVEQVDRNHFCNDGRWRTNQR
jgi:hypothetical protein